MIQIAFPTLQLSFKGRTKSFELSRHFMVVSCSLVIEIKLRTIKKASRIGTIGIDLDYVGRNAIGD